MKLSPAQLKVGSEIMGNISVAWFSAGVIAPFFLPKVSVEELVAKIVAGLALFVLAAVISLLIVKDLKI